MSRLCAGARHKYKSLYGRRKGCSSINQWTGSVYTSKVTGGKWAEQYNLKHEEVFACLEPQQSYYKAEL